MSGDLLRDGENFAALIQISLSLGHGSLSSLASLGHFSTASLVSEEKTNLEIQKLRRELREEHEKVKRLQSQLSTNVNIYLDVENSCIKKHNQPTISGACRVCIRAIPRQHDIPPVPPHPHCGGKGELQCWKLQTCTNISSALNL